MPNPTATAPVTLTKATSLQTSGAQTSGMLRQNALTDLTPNLCASRMIANPHTASATHHHEDQDTVVFAFSGSGGTIVSEGGAKRERLEPGDFALIPAWKEHQEVNEGEEVVVWCIVRSGGSPKVRNLQGWS
ncbi:hypothetical protein KC331_g3641 [Hortaea werneckii]|uniref:Cupin type-2 domain-containing protein n=1 Tax=Hortaea werneckii TaxID=91943 RepID=A0A3M7B2H2_HORWE|nr:hypothetical protein KC331_g3641 [Hortaea werneckii]KAI7714147.1 hypothetical protein KC353_g7025 [Hortaea werneckii]RMY33923.1 hypothetical protein D0865_14328 [Hortaea werneckii]